MEIKGMVSCIIPTYKRSDTLCRAINSVFAQTYSNLECIVVNDNERGDDYSNVLYTLIKQFKYEPRFVFVEQERHINGAEARNTGVKAARGEYIAFLDDDDEWLPEKIEKQVAFLQLHSDMDGVSCLYNELSNGVVFHSCPPYTSDNLHKKIINRDVAVFTSTVLLRKEKLFDSGLFDIRLLRHQDLQLLLDFTRKYSLGVVSEYLVKLHSDHAINRPSLAKLERIKELFFQSCAEHLSIYPECEQREIKAAHYFELAFAALKEKNLYSAFRYFARVGLNVKAYRNLFVRLKNRRYIFTKSK